MRRAALAALAFASLVAGAAAASEEVVDGIAAQVGTEIVLVSEVLRASRPIEAQMLAAGAPESELAKARASALEQLIEARLLARIVKQSELRASDAEVDETIASIAKENGLSPEQLQASVSSHEITFKEYREQIRQELERRKVLQTMISAKVRVEPDDLKRLYAEQYANQPTGGETLYVRQIIVLFGPEVGRTQAQACELVNVAATRIRDGVAFEDLAREISAVAPQDGGDVGWIHVDSMAPWMKEALAPLEPGGVTGVLELPFGCGLMKLVKRSDWQPITFDAAKPMLEEQAFQQKLSEEYRRWINELRDNSYIERRGYFAEAAKLGAPAPTAEGEGASPLEGTGTP